MAVVLNLGDLDLPFVQNVYYELILILSDGVLAFVWAWLVLVMALVGWVLVLDPFHTPPHLRVHLALLVVVSQHCLVLTLGPSAVFVAFFELVLLFLDYAVVTVVLMALVVLAGFLEAGILEFVRQALVHQRVQKRARYTGVFIHS